MGLGEEVRTLPFPDPLLTLGARPEQLATALAELSLEVGCQLEGSCCQDALLVGREDLDTGSPYAVWNCASSVEPLRASVELSPPEIASSTASK